MRELLEEQRALGFPAFAGTDVTIRIPLRESLLNGIIGQKFNGAGTVKGLTIQILESNRIAFDVSIDKFPIPKRLTGSLVLAPVTNFASDPRLLILYSVDGMAGVLLKMVPKSLLSEKLPDFVSISDNRVFVDFKALMVERKLTDVFLIIRALRFSTQRGTLFLELQLYIPEKGILNARAS